MAPERLPLLSLGRWLGLGCWPSNRFGRADGGWIGPGRRHGADQWKLKLSRSREAGKGKTPRNGQSLFFLEEKESSIGTRLGRPLEVDSHSMTAVDRHARPEPRPSPAMNHGHSHACPDLLGLSHAEIFLGQRQQ